MSLNYRALKGAFHHHVLVFNKFFFTTLKKILNFHTCVFCIHARSCSLFPLFHPCLNPVPILWGSQTGVWRPGSASISMNICNYTHVKFP